MSISAALFGCGVTALWAGASGIADATPLAQGGAPEIPFIRLALALTLGVALAIAAALWLKRRLPAAAAQMKVPALASWLSAPARHITVIESRRVSASADACLLESGGKRYLIVVTAGAIEVLDKSNVNPGPGTAP